MNDPPEPIRVLIVDDHPMVREGLRAMLSDEGIEVVGEAGSAAEALERCAELGPDVVLLDMQLPGEDGLHVLKELRSTRPEVAVLVVSMHEEASFVRAAMFAGARGYVLKGIGRRELLRSVHDVRAGKLVLDAEVIRSATACPETVLADLGPAVEMLSAIERDVLTHMAHGLTNRQIAERMRWSVATAKKYVQRILVKLDVSDRTEAAVTAVRRGLVN
jgi:two-component system, NarL family, response regulator DevR